MTNQFIYISPKRFQAIVSVDSDIDKLEIYDLNTSSSTKEDLEEFVYRNPSLLNPGVHTTIITDIYPSVLLPYTLDSDIEQMLLKEAWDNDSESERIMKWITGETVFSNCRIATRLDEELYHFIKRTFHPVVIIDTLQIFLNKWKGECQKYKTGELSIHLDFDSEHFYIGVIKDNDSLISAPVYNFKPDYSYSLFFLDETIKAYDIKGEDCTIFISDAIGDYNKLTEVLHAKGFKTISPKRDYRESFKEYISRRRDILSPISLIMSGVD